MRIAVSFMFCIAAMSLTLSFMSELATGRMDSLRRYESYDISISAESLEEASRFASLIGDDAFVYAITPAIVDGDIREIRFLDEDSRAFEAIALSAGTKGVCVAYSAGMYPGASFSVSTLKQGRQARVIPKTDVWRVDGVYATEDWEYNQKTIICPLSQSQDFSPSFHVGMYVNGNVEKEKRKIVGILPEGTNVLTYKETNGSLYGALLLERTVMWFLFSVLLFCVILSVKRSATHLLWCKQKEVGMLKAMGMDKTAVQSVFLQESLWVSVPGTLAGWLLSFILTKAFPLLFGFLARYSYLFDSGMTLSLPVGPLCVVSAMVIIGAMLFSFLGTRRILSRPVMEMLSDERF